MVSIIIVNYNTRKITTECILSVEKFTKELAFEIILVDNNSTDGSSEFFREKHGIKFISLGENLGFGKANNVAAKHANGEFLFFLNSDTLLTENSVKKLVDFFKANEESLQIGSLGTTLISREGKLTHSGGRLPKTGQLLTSYVKNFFSRDYNEKRIANETANYSSEITEVGYVTGADLLIRSRIFDEIGGFDPDFFMYYEDAMMGYRLQEKKLKNYVVNISKIIHLEGESYKRVNLLKRIMVEKSMFTYLFKTSPMLKYYLFRSVFFLINFPVIVLKIRRKNNIEYLRHLVT